MPKPKRKKQPKSQAVISPDPAGARLAIRNRVVEMKLIRASDLADNTKNPRLHPEPQTKAMRGVLEEIGYAGAELCYHSERNKGALTLIDGHLRKGQLADQEIPCLITDLDDDEADKLLLVFDPLSAMATQDAGKLDALLKSVATDNLDVRALLDDLAKKNQPSAGEVVQDEVPEPPKVAVTRPGDLWVMGEHRLLCGDSTKPNDVARVMNGESPAVVITDPPYGIDLQNHAAGKERSKRTFQIDGDKTQAAGIAALALVESFPCLVFANPRLPWPREWKQYLVFDKGPAVGGGDVYKYWKLDWELVQVRNTGNLNGTRDSSVLVFHVSSSSYAQHPTQKPVPLIAYLIEKTCSQTAIVYDAFLGSGTAIMAAQQLNRRCIGIEIDPLYCDVICDRFRRFTGIPAILESTRQSFDDVAKKRLGKKYVKPADAKPSPAPKKMRSA